MSKRELKSEKMKTKPRNEIFVPDTDGADTDADTDADSPESKTLSTEKHLFEKILNKTLLPPKRLFNAIKDISVLPQQQKITIFIG